jgi:DMSO/TMAO reductase YedYZ molybdopterin-dependent catalytic subunit
MTPRLYGSRWHGVAIGLLSTFAGLAVAELIVGLFRGASSPVLPVGQEVIDRVPRSVKNWAVDTFGTADKAVLILGTMLSLAVIGSLVGLLAVKGSRSAAVAVTAVVGVIGVWAVTMRPAPTFSKALPPIVGTIVSIVALLYLAPAPAVTMSGAETDESPGGRPGGVAPVARRGFLQGAATVAFVSVIAGGLGRAMKRRFAIDDERAALQIPTASGTLPDVTQPPVASVSGAADDNIDPATITGSDFGYREADRWTIANRDFYRIDTALAVPQVPIDSWSLRIHGMVDREMTLTFDDLASRPNIERYITMSCVSNEIGGGLVGNALFQGVLLKDVLDEAGVQDGATQVVSRSIDGWSCGSPTAVIMDGRDAMIAIAMNGEPLPAEHGYPVRLVVPGLYGYVSATKWVTEIELTRWEDFDGYWIPRGWSKEGPVKTMARIDRPRRSRRYSANGDGLVDIAGLAWAVHRGISKVEVSIDDGEWIECELAGVPTDDTWRQWRYRWAGAPAGEHVVRARASDGSGAPQPVGPKGVAPDGAEGYHTVKFTVA